MFETRSRFDNRFITKEFRELDLKRLREGRETTLPLNTRERAKYVTVCVGTIINIIYIHICSHLFLVYVFTFSDDILQASCL